MFWSDPTLYGANMRDLPGQMPMNVWHNVPKFIPNPYGFVPQYFIPNLTTPYIRPEMTPFAQQQLPPFVPQHLTPFMQQQVPPFVPQHLTPFMQQQAPPFVPQHLIPFMQQPINPFVQQQPNPIMQQQLNPFVRPEGFTPFTRPELMPQLAPQIPFNPYVNVYGWQRPFGF